MRTETLQNNHSVARWMEDDSNYVSLIKTSLWRAVCPGKSLLSPHTLIDNFCDEYIDLYYLKVMILLSVYTDTTDAIIVYTCSSVDDPSIQGV